MALDLFAEEHLVPFVEDVMTMEAVAMAIEGAKVYTQEAHRDCGIDTP